MCSFSIDLRIVGIWLSASGSFTTCGGPRRASRPPKKTSKPPSVNKNKTHVSVGRRRPLGHTLQETNDSRLQRLQAIINLPVFLNLSFNAEPDGAA